MQRADLIWLSVKGLGFWLALSLVGWWFGDKLVATFFPLVELIVRMVSGDFSPTLTVVGQGAEAHVQLGAWLLRPISLDGHRAIPPGTELKSQQHLMHVLVPVVIAFSIVLAWPVKRWVERFWLVLGGVLASFLVVGATLPFVLLGLVEIQVIEAAANAGVDRPEPRILQWLYFCEMGGNWILAVVSALVCISIVKQFSERSAAR